METDWFQLWRKLASAFHKIDVGDNGQPVDNWQRRARRFDAAVRQRRDRPDPLRDFILSHLDSKSIALDIGAGTGSLTIPMAKVSRQVTAIEPSEAMAGVLKENLASEGLDNVVVNPSRWEKVSVETHDIAVCSHAMYTSPDLLGFVLKMEDAAPLRFLLMRVPSHDGVLGAMSRLINGHMHDSPNFIVAFNALLDAGIYPNVMIEPTMRPWTNNSLEAAFQRAKDHMRLDDDHTFDEAINALLQEKLTFKDGLYYWPDGMRSALVWWGSRKAPSP